MPQTLTRMLSLASGAIGGICGMCLFPACAADETTTKADVKAQSTEPAGGAVARAFESDRQPASGDRPAPVPPQVGTTMRVGGYRDVATVWTGDEYRSGPSRIDTPLPEGYPAPTPPGAIDIKSYPSVRRAEVSGTLWPELGMNMAFFPLFNHIQRREIAMTAPVEMDYRGMSAENPADSPDAWTMSFLYRQAEQGPPGVDERDRRVSVSDAPPVTVVALGMRGSYGVGRVKEGLEQLARWLDENPQWETYDDARALYYNGPDTPARARWMEVQVPVRPAQ